MSSSQENTSGYLYNLANTPASNDHPWRYVVTLMIGILYFTLLHTLAHYVLKRKYTPYAEMSFRNQAEYRSYIVTLPHHIVAPCLSIWGMYWVCEEDVNVFNNFECFNTPRNVHIWCLVHTCSYFIVDLVVWGLMRRGNSVSDKQTYVHHILSFLTFYMTIAMLNFTTVFGTMLVFIELSTNFISYRWLMFKHGYGKGTASAINSLFLVTTFFFCRIIFQTYIIFWMALPAIKDQISLGVPGWQVAFYVEMFALVLLSIFINYWWFSLIIFQAARAVNRLKKNGEEEQPTDINNNDDEKQGPKNNETSDEPKEALNSDNDDNFNKAYDGLLE